MLSRISYGGRPRHTACMDCLHFVPGPRWIDGTRLGTCLEDPPVRILADCPACRLWKRAQAVVIPIRLSSDP